MTCDDDAGSGLSAEGLAIMMTVVVTVFEAASQTLSERKMKTTMLRTPSQKSLVPPHAIEASGQG